MSTFVVRSTDDMWQLMQLLRDGHDVIPHFDGALKLVVRASDGIDELKRAEAVLALQRFFHRHFCLLKYGTPHLRRLTNADRAALRLTFKPDRDGRTFEVDFSRAVNACVRVVDQQQWEDGSPSYYQSEFPTHAPYQLAQAGKREDIGKHEAARDVGIAYIHSVPPKTRTRLGYFAIVCAVIGLTTYGCFQQLLDHSQKTVAASSEPQSQIVDLDRPVVRSQDGKVASLSDKAAADMTHAIKEPGRRWSGMLASDGPERPYVHFVNDELGNIRPVLLDLAESGVMDINGLSFDSKPAKRLVRAAARQRQITSGWQTTVRRRNPIPS